MANEFPLVMLGELVQNHDSRRVPIREADRCAGPYPYYGASGIVDYVDGYLFDGEYLLIAEDGENLRTLKTPIAFLARGRFWVNNHAHVVSGNRRADTRYLMYALRQVDIRAYLTGSTIPKLTQANLHRIEVPTPPLSQQKAIGEILGALDDKIDLNRQLNETLGATLQAIFQSWFVNFDLALAGGPFPVKLNHAREPMIGPPIGDIPEGWSVRSLGEHIDVAKGLSYKGSGLAESGLPLHNLNSIREGGGYKYEGIKWYTGEFKERHVVVPGDVIVANTEQGFDHLLIGCAARIPKHFGNTGLFTHHIYRARPKPDSALTPEFLYLLLLTDSVRAQVISYTNGTTVNALSKDGLERPLFAFPPREVIARFTEMIAPMLARQEVCHEESLTLAALRDTLLPKLISGELPIRDAERLLASKPL